MPTRNAYTALVLFVSIVSGSHHSQAYDNAFTPGVPPRRLGVQATFIRLSEPSRPLFRTHVRPDDSVTDLKYGERVDRVDRGSPAYRAGLERGDVIVATYVSRERRGGRHPIRSRDQLRNAIRFSRDTVKLLVRDVRSGRHKQVTVRFGQSHDGHDHDDGYDSPRPLFKNRN